MLVRVLVTVVPRREDQSERSMSCFVCARIVLVVCARVRPCVCVYVCERENMHTYRNMYYVHLTIFINFVCVDISLIYIYIYIYERVCRTHAPTDICTLPTVSQGFQ